MPDSPPAARLGGFVATARGNSSLRVASAIRLNDRRHKLQHTSHRKTVNAFFRFSAKNLSGRFGSTKYIDSLYFYVEVRPVSWLTPASAAASFLVSIGLSDF